MDTIILIVVIISSVITISLSAIAVFLAAKKGNAESSSEIKKAIEAENAQAATRQGELVGKMSSLENVLSASLESKIKGEVLTLQTTMLEQAVKQAEDNHRRLAEYQTRVTSQVQEAMKQANDTVNKRLDSMTESLQKRVGELTNKVNGDLLEVQKRIGAGLTEGTEAYGKMTAELQKKLGKLEEAQRQMEGLQKDVISLNSVLSSNQKRGAYGELQLEKILESVFPSGRGTIYEIQKQLEGDFIDDERVRPDAAIINRTNGVVTRLCIDSKFPLSDYLKLFDGGSLSESERKTLKKNFESAVKERAKEIKRRYVGKKGTEHHAMMFIPNDGVFAYISTELGDVVREFQEEGVIMTCPSLFGPFIRLLQSTLQEAKRNKEIESTVLELKKLGKEFERMSERWTGINKAVRGALSKLGEFDITVTKIGRGFNNINNAGLAIEDKSDEIIVEPSDE